MGVVVGELTADGSEIVVIANGSLVEVEYYARKRLRSMTPLITKSDPPGAVIMPVSWPAVVQLVEEFGDSWRPGPRLTEWIRDQVVKRTSPVELGYKPPAGLEPYPWQRDGAGMIAAVGKALITDEPGVGKTITAILGLVERARRGLPVFPALVVAPASVIDHWVESWSTWAPHLRTVAYRGTPAKRRELVGTADVYVTSYDTCRMDAGPRAPRKFAPLLDLGPKTVVVDECHYIKTPRAVRSQAVRRLAKGADNIVALSGTPITHHPGDLWPTLVAIDHDAWPSRERWLERYCDTVTNDYAQEVLGLNRKREPEFRMTLLGQHRRVAKADVLAQLPPKVYSVRTVELPPQYRKAYEQMEQKMLAELPDGEELSAMSVLAQLTRLAQLSSAAADLQVTKEVGDDGKVRETVNVRLKAPSWKVDALLEILAERPGQPVVTFAPFKQLIMLAGEAAEKAGYHVGYIVGGQSMDERTRTVEAFQEGKFDLLCVTTGAGGVGLTLTRARTAVFLQRPWSLVEAMQAEDRVHRIGSEQHDSVEIIDIVAKNTLDSRVRAVLREKAGQLADLVQDPRIVAELLGGSSSRPVTKAGSNGHSARARN